MLVIARERLRASVHLDDRLLLPAWQRYAGTMYREMRDELLAYIRAGGHAVIISGGYGLLLPDEPIGFYDARFHISWWPVGLLERCLPTYAQVREVKAVVAYAAASTDYAKLVRSTRWVEAGVKKALLVAPKTERVGGAQVLVPRALGQAVAAFWRQELTTGWVSSDGLTLSVQRLG